MPISSTDANQIFPPRMWGVPKRESLVTKGSQKSRKDYIMRNHLATFDVELTEQEVIDPEWLEHYVSTREITPEEHQGLINEVISNLKLIDDRIVSLEEEVSKLEDQKESLEGNAEISESHRETSENRQRSLEDKNIMFALLREKPSATEEDFEQLDDTEKERLSRISPFSINA